MGCGGSKVDDLPLVTLCRERRQLIKAASDHRYALAASHVSYFRSLKDVGDALCRFVDQELVIAAAANGVSPPDSPVLTLPSDEGKKKKSNNGSSSNNSHNNSSSATSTITHSAASNSHHHSPDHDSHLHLSSGSETDSEDDDNDDDFHAHHDHAHNDHDHHDQVHYNPGYPHQEPFSFPQYNNNYPSSNGINYPSSNGMNSYAYFMKRSSVPNPTMYYEEPRTVQQLPESSNVYSGYPQYGGGMSGYFGMPMGSPPDPYYSDPYYQRRPPSPPRRPPSPPPPPQVSSWDFFNPFESVEEDAYPAYYPPGRYGVAGSSSSSPDSVEVRRREGIPDLEDEMQQVPIKKRHKAKEKMEDNLRGDSGEGSSRAVPLQNEDIGKSVDEKETKSSPEISESKSVVEEEITRKKGVSFEVDMPSAQEIESSEPSSLTTLSAHGTLDIEEVVTKIKDEFETASGYGKEVGVMLEVGKLPYQPITAVLKVFSSRIFNSVSPEAPTHSHHQPRKSRSSYLRIMKMAKANYGDSENDFRMKSGSLSSTLETLYAWEKKLYKEVKDEERLRVVYEKQCKRLKSLDQRGAESNKIDATQASISKLLTRINVNIRAIEAISSRIHKLRDEELQPQITELIHGLIRMWNFMLKCHQKQFQAIVESKRHALMAKTGGQRNSSLKGLQEELLKWSNNFIDWINTQKAYVESLNEWLLRCLLKEPEETPDGLMPFSPGRAGAPPVFVICNDWYQAMERLSESEVASSMQSFALSLHQLWERQDEEQRQRLKAEYLSNDFDKRVRSLQKKQGMLQHERHERDALSDKSAISAPTESGVSPLDDLKVDLDSMRKRLEDEKARHHETVKQVHQAASSSLQAGLIPIFEALGNFTSETLKSYEHVRVPNIGEAT